MKKLLCAVLSATMLMSGAVVVNAEKTFTDLDEAPWAESYILEMAEMGFISGYSDKTFKPNKDVSHLEGLVLFSRAMGSNSDAMEKVIEFAIEEYGDIVDEYNLSFGKKEVCFLLYRGALTVDELDSYIASEIANEPMKRHEAAIIITKAMSGEKEAKSELLLDLSYEDTKEIPAKATKYVYYVTKKGIMNGVSGNLFSPNTNVKRSQIAVMLSRAVDQMGISFIETMLTEVVTTDGLVVTADGEFEYTENTKMCLAGKEAAASTMPKNVSAMLVLVRDELVFVDTYESTSPETVSGIFKEHFTTNDVLSVQVKETGAAEYEYYECAKEIVVSRNGEDSTVFELDDGDYVTLTLKDGIVIAISAEQKTKIIENAIVEEIRFDDEVILKISHSDFEYDGMEFVISDDVRVAKRNAEADLSDILRGDKVTITTEYGKVTKIAATSVKRSVSGVIKEIHISANPYLIIDISGDVDKYDIPANVNIVVNDAVGSIYDFRISDSVKLTIESQALTNITVTSSPASIKSISNGEVTAINVSFGEIKVEYDDNGVTREETIKIKDQNGRISVNVVGSDGNSMKVSNIDEGDIVSVRGSIINGVFYASLIVVEG